jgi:cell division protease FtsH
VIDKEVREIIDSQYELAHQLLLTHKKELELIAGALLDQETLEAEQFVAIIEAGVLPAPTSPHIHHKKESVGEKEENSTDWAQSSTSMDLPPSPTPA